MLADVVGERVQHGVFPALAPPDGVRPHPPVAEAAYDAVVARELLQPRLNGQALELAATRAEGTLLPRLVARPPRPVLQELQHLRGARLLREAGGVAAVHRLRRPAELQSAAARVKVRVHRAAARRAPGVAAGPQARGQGRVPARHAVAHRAVAGQVRQHCLGLEADGALARPLFWGGTPNAVRACGGPGLRAPDGPRQACDGQAVRRRWRQGPVCSRPCDGAAHAKPPSALPAAPQHHADLPAVAAPGRLWIQEQARLAEGAGGRGAARRGGSQHQLQLPLAEELLAGRQACQAGTKRHPLAAYSQPDLAGLVRSPDELVAVPLLDLDIPVNAPAQIRAAAR
mmetsp:Transcript_63421/g.171058  ORF Transcript_63421/g.171058 Transcript_63421/m.171058 type:complete len:343 (+) Transcript_63421:263-1291(+)